MNNDGFENVTQNEIIPFTMEELTGKHTILSTLQTNDIFANAMIANAVTGACDNSKVSEIKDAVTIYVEDFVVVPVELEPKNKDDIVNERGMVECDRIVLITDDGKCYSATSKGIKNSLTGVCGVMGLPHTKYWKQPLPLRITPTDAKNGKTFIIGVDMEELKKMNKASK